MNPIDRADRAPIWDSVHQALRCVGTYTNVFHIASSIARELQCSYQDIEQILTRSVDPRFFLRIDELGVQVSLRVKPEHLCQHPECVVMRVHLL